MLVGGELFAFGDDDTLSTEGFFDIGIDELLPSNDMLRQLWTESGRVKLVSFFVIDDGPIDFCPLYKLLVLLVKLLFDGGPVTGGRPLGGFATNPFIPGSGILLGLLRFGVSGHLAIAASLSCWSCADSVELLCLNSSSMVNGIIAFMLGVEIFWECGIRFGVDVCIIVMPSWDDNRELTLLDWWSGLESEREEASFDSITRNWARVPSSSIFRSSICCCGEKRKKSNKIASSRMPTNVLPEILSLRRLLLTCRTSWLSKFLTLLPAPIAVAAPWVPEKKQSRRKVNYKNVFNRIERMQTNWN